MRWKPLVDCYRRHEAPGGILAVENARGLQSQTQPDETDSRPSRYLRHPYPAAAPSKRYIPSIVPCTFVVINFSFFFSLSPYFFFFSVKYGEKVTLRIIKWRRKTWRARGIILFTSVMVLEVDGNFARSKFCLREELSSTGGVREVYDVEKWEASFARCFDGFVSGATYHGLKILE